MKFLILVHILCLCFSQIKSQLFPKIIWMYWNLGEDMTDSLGKACYTRIKQINSNWQPRFVQDSTIITWLNQSQIKQLNLIKDNSFISATPQGFSYFLRLMLLKKYGGVWVDAHTILLQDLNWLNDLGSNPQVINKIGNHPQAFVFFKNDKTQLGFFESYTESDTILYPTINIQIDLIAAIPQSKYIIDLLDELKRIHLNEKQYFQKVKTRLGFKDDYSDYWTLHLANTIVRFKQLRNYQQNMHKKVIPLQSAFYNVWMISRIKGPFYLALQIQGRSNINVMFRNIDQTYNKPKYLIKLHHFNQWQKAYKYLINQEYRVDYHVRNSNAFIFDYGEMYLPEYYKCLYRPFISENSIINKYVIQGSSIPYFETLKVYKDSELPWICSQTHLLSLYNHKNKILDFLYIPFLILVFIEIFIEFNIKLTKFGIQLKEQKLCQTNKQAAKQTLYFISNLCYIVVLHYNYFESQVLIWWYDSPYSIFIFLIYISMVLLCLSYSLLSKQTLFQFKIQFKMFVFIMILVSLFELFILQAFGVWRSTAPLLHLQTLIKMNKQNLFQVINGLCKMGLMFCLGFIYFNAKNMLWLKNKKTIIKSIKELKQKINKQIKFYYQRYFQSIKVKIFEDESSNQESNKLTVDRDREHFSLQNQTQIRQ